MRQRYTSAELDALCEHCPPFDNGVSACLANSTAYMEGYLARVKGMGIISHDYLPESVAARAFEAGWCDRDKEMHPEQWIQENYRVV